ncbi:MAG: DNA replication and repair protein RecF [Candidatus Krumholzibacteriales bacterium]
MRLLNLELRNFRNLKDTRLEFSPAVNLITGRNSQGKTNLLEAVYLFCLGRSFRSSNRTDMISFGEEHLFLKASVESDTGVGETIEIGMSRGGEKRIRVNGARVEGFSGVIGKVPGVLFTAGDVDLVAGSPSSRRSFIDHTASQISSEYLGNLREYYRALRQRNAELKEAGDGKGRGLTRALAALLAEKGEKVVSGRRDVLSDIRSASMDLLREIFTDRMEVGMNYISSVREGEGGYSENMISTLERRADEEIRRGYTVAGPHRDDIRITMDKLNMRKFGSQGRKRLIAIVMKIAQAEVINSRKGEKPLVLLDDIFSELDRGVEREVGGFISGKYQNFITSPRAVELAAPGKSAGFTVENGVIT